MKLNILIVGKNSFLSKNLFKFLKKKINVKKIGFIEFLKLKKIKLLKYDVVINCAINKLYYKKKYSEKNDIDLICGKKLSNLNQKLIIFSTSKVYGPGSNLKENSKKKPIDNYGKNKLITERKIQKVKKELLIFRLSNIVGETNNLTSRKVTNLFFDDIRKNLRKNLIIIPKKNYFKDFILIDDFLKIIYFSIMKNMKGIYNLSTNIKIYLHDLARDISLYTGAKIIYSNNKTFSFTLNNKKLLKKIKIIKNLKNLRKNFYKIL
mgnify:CR=1 FL=1|tara:strand:- start:192 stop:983 length:792 start_codon:yes stop_codon:yes gene_type:complete